MKNFRRFKTQNRDIRHRSGENYIGSVAFKDQRIPYESSLERDFVYLALSHSTVCKVISQSNRIDYVFEGKVREYTSDFCLVTETGEMYLFEVKPETKYLANQQRFKVIQEVFLRKEYVFAVVTDSQIRQGRQVRNAEEVLDARRRYEDDLEPSIITETQKWLLEKPGFLVEEHQHKFGLESYLESIAYLHKSHAELIKIPYLGSKAKMHPSRGEWKWN
ncbi:TnsA endonuclease N-terminal domain-containing protein [Thiomicrorhabdus cannonii]|uniref:TnsA endonuclease N-terminal domain-containing protein n=1 Tax=Thiomicrorhabdus cannonii TaxID=2748011 RepID=UPI0015BCB284|nr:TnsA endonuclease N-terminal domain-containing protein [Thiomicrorhabdus cannonii]